ncbi:MAG: hypothetical protein OXB98_00695 [Bryobacterales bacterium]|nr:hypothetical protein [Bryobacterales bacterium]
MLVYANRLCFQGADAEQAVFKGIGVWLKQQLGYGLHPDQLKQDGDYAGHRGEKRSRLRIHGCYDGVPALCAWVLKHADDDVRGRRWIVEVGVKKTAGTLEVTCVVKTDEHSTLVSNPVSASQPRVIWYIVRNIRTAKQAFFAGDVPGENLKNVGQDRYSYQAFLEEIERHDRASAIVLVSATRDGEYLVNPSRLQKTLVGLANVVQVVEGSNSYEMAEILGKPQSAWDGSVNVLSIPLASGFVRSRYFLPDEIQAWGREPQRVSQILAWVTANTNIPRLRMHVRPEGVRLLSMRRRMAKVRMASAQMDIAQLRQELDEAYERIDNQESYFNEIVEENATLQNDLLSYKNHLADVEDKLRQKNFALNFRREVLSPGDNTNSVAFDFEPLLKLAKRKEEPSPLECIEIIEQLYADRCILLDSARSSAKKMSRFIHGRDLLDLLVKLVTTYRDGLMDGGDSKARGVFGKGEYAARESETVTASKAMRRQRTFDYDGEKVEMYRHLKIGVDDDPTRTIRVHFYWDGDRQKIVIGYCGEHLPVPSH